MKKFLIIFFFIFLMLPVFAESDYNCPTPPYPVSGKISNFFNTITGANWTSRKAVEQIIETNLKKNTNAKFDVKLSIFNATDLVAGKFKTLKFHTENVNLDGFYVHDLQGQTYCEYNRIVFQKNQKPQIYEDFILNFSGKIDNTDIQKATLSADFKDFMQNFQINLGGYQLFKVTNPQISIVNNKIRYSFNLVASVLFASFAQNIVFETGLKVQNGRLAFSDVKIGNIGNISFDDANKILRSLNPLKINLEKSLGLPSYLRINDVNIENNEIHVVGTLVIPKNV